MILKNKLEIAFGPFGSSTGFFIMIGGIIATFYSLIGPVIVIIGAFAAFTSTSTRIDTDKKRIKLSNNLFGIIPVGKWIEIKPGMKLGLKKSLKQTGSIKRICYKTRQLTRFKKIYGDLTVWIF